MRSVRFVVFVAAMHVVAGCTKADSAEDMGSASARMSGATAPDAAEYTLVFKNRWTPSTHPLEYPRGTGPAGPHLSGIVGVTHNLSYAMFTLGAIPSPGLEKLSEEGKPTPLDEEVRAAIATGAAGTLFTTEPLRDLKDSLVVTFRTTATHPMVTLVAMIAPSPDWFAGVRDVSLRANGQWVASKTVDLLAFDSGGDDGTTYTSPDRDNNPKKFTTMSRSRHFVTNNVATPVATVTFTKK